MKYWVFQNNQVLGPYEPDDLSRMPAFTAESLVCSEGRRGTSMGDWQRAGMVPDLSVSLVKAAQSHAVKSPVMTLAGLPPEPTLKDLAVLGSLQEKMGMLEDVVLQLQEGLRVKDAELAALHEQLAGKDRESAQFKSESAELKKQTESLRAEIDARRREIEDARREEAELKGEADEFKKKVAGLEERLGAVARLGETVDKAVEAETRVESDVAAHGATLAELAKELVGLRAQIAERLSAAPVVAPLPAGLPAAAAPAPSPRPAEIRIEPPGKVQPPPPAPEFPDIAPGLPASAAAPAAGAEPSVPPAPAPFEPGAFAGFSPAPGAEAPSPLPTFDPLAPLPAPAPAPVSEEPAAVVDQAAPKPAPSRKKALVVGGALGLAAIAALGVVSGRFGKRKAKIPAAAEQTPLPPPVAESTPAAAVPAPPPPPDPRDVAIEAAKSWTLPSGKSLGAALETLAPPSGNLSPWMAEPLADGRVQVNYFARGAAAGSPTIAYEFEVDPASKQVAGRNAAAKAVLKGKAAPPPAPPKPKPVKVKPKPAAKPAAAKPEESLDSLLGSPEEAPPAKAEPAPAAEPAPKKTAAKRAAKAKKADASAPQGKADDQALLDDLLKE